MESVKGLPTIQPAKTVEYETPKDLFDELWDEFGGFDFDPCCRPAHYTASKVIANGGKICVPDRGAMLNTGVTLLDGLAHSWHGKVFMNPPYGPALKLWVPKAVHEVGCGNAERVVALLPAKTEVKWFQEYVMRCAYRNGTPGPNTFIGGSVSLLARDIRFLKGRLKFGGGDGGPARCGNVIVVWRK